MQYNSTDCVVLSHHHDLKPLSQGYKVSNLSLCHFHAFEGVKYNTYRLIYNAPPQSYMASILPLCNVV